MILATLAWAIDAGSLRAGMEAADGWADLDTKVVEGVSVRVRHKPVGDQHCLEGTTTSSASPDLLLSLATAIEDQPRWSSWKVTASEKLSTGATEFDYLQVLDNPPPVSDRYWVLHATSFSSGGEWTFRWSQIDADARYPEAVARVRARHPGAVMTTVNVGDWTFRPTASGTSVRYRICTDAGGHIPDWMGQFAARTTLPTNLADLVREAARRAGADATP